MSETLFDASVYGDATPPRRKRGGVTLPIEPLQPGWVNVRNRHGVFPYAHLVKVDLTLGSVATLCGLTGSKLTNAGVDHMVRCPACDLAEQLS